MVVAVVVAVFLERVTLIKLWKFFRRTGSKWEKGRGKQEESRGRRVLTRESRRFTVNVRHLLHT